MRSRAWRRSPMIGPETVRVREEIMHRSILRYAFTAGVLAGTLASPLAAQGTASKDRMPSIPAEKLTEAQKKAAEAFAEGRGYAVRGPFVPLIRSPEVMLRAKAMGDYLRFKSTLGPRLNEMVILITAREWTQQYEWHAHAEIARKEGLRGEIVEAIADGRRPTGMAQDEDIAYNVATEILRLKRVSDGTYRDAVAKFGEQGVIDLLGVVGYYNFLAIVMNATRTALPEGVAEPLRRYPE